jgi:hypothetical protein
MGLLKGVRVFKIRSFIFDEILIDREEPYLVGCSAISTSVEVHVLKECIVDDYANFLLAVSSVYSSTLKMEAVRSSEMSVNFYRTTRRHILHASIVLMFIYCRQKLLQM